MKNILVTGGAGFIGSNFCHYIYKNFKEDYRIFVLDKITYAANLENLKGLDYKFYKGDIGDAYHLSQILEQDKIDIVFNFAAETHVDNSISGPDIFIEANIISLYNLVKVFLDYQNNHKKDAKLIHISTDEVFGDLEMNDPKFTEKTPYNPSSPYSASKAAGDMIINSYCRTFGLNAIILHCTNNYGLRQFPEKLLPKTIKACIERKPITIYGNGKNIRDWIHVDDFCKGIYLSLERGKSGEHYCFGGKNERTNVEIVNEICEIFNDINLKNDNFDYRSLIVYVEDRKGHDFRYAVDFSKSKRELGFDHETIMKEKLKEIIKYELEK